MDITSCSQNTQKGKNHFSQESLELLELHNAALGFNTQDPT
jgi:hypothetical protein